MATDTTRSLTYQTLLTVTHDEILGTGMPEDQVFNQRPLSQWLHSGGRFKVIDGGYELRQGLLYGTNSTAGWYSGYDTIDVQPQEGVTTAVFSWKQGGVSVVYSGKELRQNKGSRTKIYDLIKTKQMQAEESMANVVTTGLYSDGTGTSSKQLTGLAAMCETTPGSTSYASVPTANTQWRNQADASVGAAATNLLSAMRTQYNNASNGLGPAGTAPDFIVTDQTTHEAYEALMTPQLRYTSTTGNDIGIQAPQFKGVPVVWDPACTSGYMYMLNGRHISLVVHRDANMTMAEGGFVRPANQDGYIGVMLLMGNLVTNNRRKHVVLAGIS